MPTSQTDLDVAPASAGPGPAPSLEDDCGDLVEDELLVEEISIDGMCGVY